MNPSVVLLMLCLSFVAGGCAVSAYWLGRVQRLERALLWERRMK